MHVHAWCARGKDSMGMYEPGSGRTSAHVQNYLECAHMIVYAPVHLQPSCMSQHEFYMYK